MDYLPTEDFARRPLTWLKMISENGGTVSYAPSFGYELCARRVSTMAEGALGLDLSRWRMAGIGGEMIKPNVMQAFAAAFRPYGFSDKAFCASYGLAECVLAVSFSEAGTGMLLDHVDKDALEAHRAVPAPAEAEGSRTFVSCGKVLPEHRGEIRDEEGKVLGERQVGRFFVQGPSVMQGYFNDDEATKAALIDGWLDTGDLAYWIGDELVIVGRAKDMIDHQRPERVAAGYRMDRRTYRWPAFGRQRGDHSAQRRRHGSPDGSGAMPRFERRRSPETTRRSPRLKSRMPSVSSAMSCWCRPAACPRPRPASSPAAARKRCSRPARFCRSRRVPPLPRDQTAVLPVVAVTGATGFIGRHIVKRLTEAGYAVRALARRLPTQDQAEDDSISWVLGALNDEAALKSLVKGASGVVHCAGAIRAASRAEFLAVNADATRRLAEIAANEGRPPAFRLHVVPGRPSSASVALCRKQARRRASPARPPGPYSDGDAAPARRLWPGRP